MAGSVLTSSCYWQGPSFFTDITGEYNYTVANPDTHLFWDVVCLWFCCRVIKHMYVCTLAFSSTACILELSRG